MNDQAAIDELVYTRVFDAPRELVFRCLIEPEHLTHFWGPIGGRTPLGTIKADPRPCGGFETGMVNDAHGTPYPARAPFVKITNPWRLVWARSDIGASTTP